MYLSGLGRTDGSVAGISSGGRGFSGRRRVYDDLFHSQSLLYPANEAGIFQIVHRTLQGVTHA